MTLLPFSRFVQEQQTFQVTFGIQGVEGSRWLGYSAFNLFVNYFVPILHILCSTYPLTIARIPK